MRQTELHLLLLKHTVESMGKKEIQGFFTTQVSDSITGFRWTFPHKYQEFLFCLLRETTTKWSHWGHTSPLCLSHTHRPTWRHLCTQNDPLGRVCPCSAVEFETKPAACVWFPPSHPSQPQTEVTTQKPGCLVAVSLKDGVKEKGGFSIPHRDVPGLQVTSFP